MQNKHESFFLFLSLVFVLSIPFWVLEAIKPIQLLPGLPISALGAFTPALAALILVYRNESLQGAIQLLRRSFDVRRIKNKVWLLVAFILNPAFAVLAYWIISANGTVLPRPAPLSLAVFPMLISFFVAGLGEEIGWTGYATEPLQRRWGAVVASILLGFIWAVWHIIALLQVHRPVEWIAWWSLGTIALRMIMVWLYNHTGQSVFAATVFHTMINLCWQLFPNNGSYYDPQVFGVITFCFAIAVFTIEWRITRVKPHVA